MIYLSICIAIGYVLGLFVGYNKDYFTKEED